MKKALIFIAFIYVNNIFAQRLPNVQQVSLLAPKNVKIDGKTIEWGNELGAYNKNTRIYYSIANDANNLYLVIKISDFAAIKKALAGGITFTINQNNKKKDSTTAAFTFPFYIAGQKQMSINEDITLKDKPEDKLRLDSFVNVYNRQIPTFFKMIGVRGLSMSDDVVSIYNHENIKSSALFDNTIAYNCELSIPLKLLKNHIQQASKFNYNIQLNGQTTIKGYAIKGANGRSEILYYEDNKGVNYVVAGPNASPRDRELYYPTDFWGEYTLAK